MQARTMVSLAASLLLTGAMVSSLMMPPTPAPRDHVSSINGIPVVDLPGITVYPDATSHTAVRRTSRHGHTVASRMTADDGMLEQLTGEAASRVIGSHLSMPYYSFGSDIGQISKD